MGGRGSSSRSSRGGGSASLGSQARQEIAEPGYHTATKYGMPIEYASEASAKRAAKRWAQ